MVWISDILTVSPVSTDTDVAMARWSVMRHEVHESDDVVEPKECQRRNATMLGRPEAAALGLFLAHHDDGCEVTGDW